MSVELGYTGAPIAYLVGAGAILGLAAAGLFIASKVKRNNTKDKKEKEKQSENSNEANDDTID